MSKLQASLVSLVAIVPAGILGYLIVVAMMGHLDAITGSTPVLAAVGFLLLSIAAVIVSPALLFVAGSDVEEPLIDGESSGILDEDEDEVLHTGEFETVDEDEDEMLQTGEFDTVDEDEEFGDEEDWDDDEWDDEED